MADPAADLTASVAAAAAALVDQVGMGDTTARYVAGVALAAALPALPPTVRSIAALTSDAAAMHLGVAIHRAVGPAVDAALTEERAITGPATAALTWERDELAARLAQLDVDDLGPGVYAAARAAVLEAWPDLAADPVYVEQLVAVAVGAAWTRHRTPPSDAPTAGAAEPVALDTAEAR